MAQCCTSKRQRVREDLKERDSQTCFLFILLLSVTLHLNHSGRTKKKKSVWKRTSNNCPVEKKRREKKIVDFLRNERHHSVKADILLSNIYRGFQKALDWSNSAIWFLKETQHNLWLRPCAFGRWQMVWVFQSVAGETGGEDSWGDQSERRGRNRKESGHFGRDPLRGGGDK